MKRMLIDDTQPEETRVVIVDGNKVEDVEFESSAKKQIKGNIFTAKVVRIEPSLQAAFVDYGGNRHGFLAFGEIHPDYYNISDEIKEEVSKEVDEIIERKRIYLAERKAEQERRKLERERKRAEYEAMRAAEAKAAAESGEEISAPMEGEAEEEGHLHTDCGCGPDCACRAADGECHCHENGVCNCSLSETTEETFEASEVDVETNDNTPEETSDIQASETTLEETVDDNEALKEEPVAENLYDSTAEENGTFEGAVEEVLHTDTLDEAEEVATPVETTFEDVIEIAKETVEAGEEIVETTEEAASNEATEVSEDDGQRTPRRRTQRRGPRFLGRRVANRGKYKVSAEAAGLQDESVAEDLSAEDMADDDFDMSVGKEFDNDDDGADSERFLEIQRKLIFARKLYRRSSIQDVIKEGQVLLIQVVKEERGNKGAACTTYLSLAGRYCVLMPNRIRSGGVSRKITTAGDRKRLKDIMHELPLNDDMSLIIRTAGEDKKREDIVRDYNYLIRTWNHIRHTALTQQAPSLIFEEGNLIKRALRDMYTKDIGEVIIDGDAAYKTAKEFSKILSPNMGRKIKCRKPDELPVFQHYQIERELDKLHNPIVQLASGGYLVINPTEALVSIDVNSGRATHEMDIEETALKTNLEAADEIAKQLRMRNLAGLVVVDFIDMAEPANNHAVERRMKEAMKSDRARVQIAKMSMFGLLEISRQRLHSSFVESNYVTCPYCGGQGVQRTTESSATLVLRAIEEEGIRGSFNHLEIRLPQDTAIYILNHKRRNLADLEEKYDLTIIISADSAIKNINDYKIERTRVAKPKTETAATAYAPQLVAGEVSSDEDVFEEDTFEPQAENDNDNRNRRGRHDRRRNRFDRRRGRYHRSNETEAALPVETPVEEEKVEKKKAWWKKLLG